MKGKLPITEKIILESEESQWRLVTRGIINELKTTGVVEISTERRVRIRLLIKEVIPPETMNKQTRSHVYGNLGPDSSQGLARINEFISDIIERDAWIFTGIIEGDKIVPIVIMYYPVLQVAIYSQKLKQEKREEFFSLS
jgi:hypothetical protein